jgi:O-antigen ligase
MTYEPNWFAEQIAFLLMPWLFTAVFSGYSAFRWRLRRRWLTVELLMLIWAAGVLIFTYSRTGMILLAVQLVLVFLFRPRVQKQLDISEKAERLKLIFKRLLQAGLAFTVLAGIIFVAGTRNNYFARLWNYWTDEESTGQYLQYIAFDQRITYWRAAYRMYEAYPVLGVGLGNFTFYFEQFLDDRALHPTPELLTKLTPEEGRSQLSTVKGVFPRILAETGLLGMAVFLAFLFALLGAALYLALAPEPEPQFWGRAGLLGLVVFLVVSFSYDSFSLPNMWVMFGFITAAAQVFTSRCDRLERSSQVMSQVNIQH